MLKKILNVVVIAFAVLGVLFLILLFIPDDSDNTAEAVETEETIEETIEEEEETEEEAEEEITEDEKEEENAAEETEEATEETLENDSEEEDAVAEEEKEDDGNRVDVNIPDSEISDFKLTFRSTTLDNKKVTQDIFSDYDITAVFVWGTYCGSCISEMGEYASMYENLPDNVNLVGILLDVYDGIDSNVKDANDILDDAGAGFTNIRTSDDLYGLVSNVQYIPSSFFVDREGHIVGGLLEGAGYNETYKALKKYMD